MSFHNENLGLMFFGIIIVLRNNKSAQKLLHCNGKFFKLIFSYIFNIIKYQGYEIMTNCHLNLLDYKLRHK